MSKEEILKRNYSSRIANPDKVYAQNPAIIEAAHESMEEYAKQMAIDFAAYTADNLWGHYKGQWYQHMDEDNPKTNDQLYAHFMESQNNDQ